MNESDQPSAARPLVYRPLRAPRGDGEMLVEPSFDAVGDMVRENVQLHGRAGYDFGGRSLADLARQARADSRAVSEYIRVLLERHLYGALGAPHG